MKQFEIDFLDWAKNIMVDVLPRKHAKNILSDLSRIFSERDDNRIELGLRLFSLKLTKAYRDNDLKLIEISEKINGFRKDYKNYMESEEGLYIFKMEL